MCDVSRTPMPKLSLDKTPMDQMTATVSTLLFQLPRTIIYVMSAQSDMILLFSFLPQALKEIIFGSPMACFTEEWKQQNFTFSDTPGLKYGIVQKKVQYFRQPHDLLYF